MRAAVVPEENPKLIHWIHPRRGEHLGFSFQHKEGNAGNKVCNKEKLQRGLNRVQSSKRTKVKKTKVLRNEGKIPKPGASRSLNSLPAHPGPMV